MAMPARGQGQADVVVGWSMKQEKKRIVVDYDCFQAILAADELPSRGTTFKAGESIGVTGLWSFYLKHETSWFDTGYLDFDAYTSYVSGYFVLDPSTKDLPGTPSTIKAKVTMSLVVPDTNVVLGSKATSDLIMDPFTEFQISNVYDLPTSGEAKLIILKIPERVRVIIDITIYADGAVYSVKDQTERARGFVQDLVEDLGKALETGNAADVAVMVPKVRGSMECHARQAHKFILAARSPVFERMFSTENGMIEGKTGEVFIKDMTPKGLDIFLKFIYTGKIVPEWPEVVEDLVNAAEKYQLSKLTKFLDEKLISICKAENVVELHKLAKKFGLSKGQTDIADFARKDANIFSSILGNI